MSKLFQYSILRYRHSYFLSEELNVGILFLFPREKRVEFLYPDRLQRISSLYPDFSVHTLRNYLKAFESQAQKLTERFSEGDRLFEIPDLQAIITDFFLKEDATALFFTDIKQGKYEDAKKTLEFYRDQYLSVYDTPERDYKDDQYIINKVEEGLKASRLDYSQDIKRDYIVETPYLSRTFDIAWKNGTTNLVTPISLDLKQKESIERKATTWHGRLNIFQEKAKEDKLKFDLIVSRPEEKDLFKTYDNVLKILEGNKTPKEIFEVDKVNIYVEQIVRSFKS